MANNGVSFMMAVVIAFCMHNCFDCSGYTTPSEVRRIVREECSSYATPFEVRRIVRQECPRPFIDIGLPEERK